MNGELWKLLTNVLCACGFVLCSTGAILLVTPVPTSHDVTRHSTVPQSGE